VPSDKMLYPTSTSSITRVCVLEFFYGGLLVCAVSWSSADPKFGVVGGSPVRGPFRELCLLFSLLPLGDYTVRSAGPAGTLAVQTTAGGSLLPLGDEGQEAFSAGYLQHFVEWHLGLVASQFWPRGLNRRGLRETEGCRSTSIVAATVRTIGGVLHLLHLELDCKSNVCSVQCWLTTSSSTSNTVHVLACAVRTRATPQA